MAQLNMLKKCRYILLFPWSSDFKPERKEKIYLLWPTESTVTSAPSICFSLGIVQLSNHETNIGAKG